MHDDVQRRGAEYLICIMMSSCLDARGVRQSGNKLRMQDALIKEEENDKC